MQTCRRKEMVGSQRKVREVIRIKVRDGRQSESDEWFSECRRREG